MTLESIEDSFTRIERKKGESLLMQGEVCRNLATLQFLAFCSKRRNFDRFTRWATLQTARLNIFLNRPKASKEVENLAKTWQSLMPPDGEEFFKVTEDTAYTEIYLHCPLRGSGDVDACYKLMNYDRKLMEKVGGQLVVLESQSNSGKPFCSLAIRKKRASIKDLIPAHEK